MMKSPTFIVGLVVAATFVFGADQPAVRVAPTDSVGPRALEAQTKAAVVRDYLQAWGSLSRAFEQNQADILDADFVGVATPDLARENTRDARE